MTLLTLHCKSCKVSVTNDKFLTLYEQIPNSYHLIIKDEHRSDASLGISLVENDEKKSIKFVPRKILCKNCQTKIGTESLIGPNDEAALCFKALSIYFINDKNQIFEFNDYKHKWRNHIDQFKNYIDLRDYKNFNQEVKDSFKKIKIDYSKFESNKMPILDEAINFNISELTMDLPRTYQVECYLACLSSNTIVYLPTGSGKTMIAAMIVSFMKKINPKKKIFFVCDRIPLVFQQASYIRNQTGLKVGEFCSENKELMSNQLDSDVCVFTCDLLINLLQMKKIFIEECCCLIIDEIHHAKNNHSFAKLINTFYNNLSIDLKPRLIGLTASPSSSAIQENDILCEIDRLSCLISGSIYMPLIYKQDLNSCVNRPEIQFYEVDRKDQNFLNILNNFAFKFLINLNPSFKSETKINIENNQIKSYINNILHEPNIEKNQKKFSLSILINKLITSSEILDIIGSIDSKEFLVDYLDVQIENNSKNKIWSDMEIKEMKTFVEKLKIYKSNLSAKLEKLLEILKNSNNDDQRCIIFVRKRYTARLLQSQLNKDDLIKKKLRPMIFVGHANGSYDGMEWHGEQEIVLEKFRNGFCKLLVSTNVLQEGLDVPVCNKVILFDNFLNMTEFLQSRGRARDMKSEFIQICRIGDAKKYNKIIETEKNLSNIIKFKIETNKQYEFLNHSAIKLSSLIKSEQPNRNLNLFKMNSYPKNLKLNFQIYIDNNTYCNLTTILNRTKGYTELNKIETQFVLSDLTYDQEDYSISVFNVKYELKNNKEFKNEYEFANEIINNLLKEFAKPAAIYWFRSRSRFNNEIVSLMSSEINFGNLINPFEFLKYKNSNSITNIKMIFKLNVQLIILLLFIDNCLHKIEIKFDQIDNFIVIKENKDSFNIYISLNRPYLLYKLLEEDENNNIKSINTNINDEYLKWKRVLLNKDSKLNWSALEIKTDLKDKQSLIDLLYSIKEKKCIFVDLKVTCEEYYTIDKLREKFRFTDFDSKYSLECFISQSYSIINGKLNSNFSQLLNTCLDSRMVSKCLEKLTQYLETRRYLNLNKILTDIIDNYQISKAKNESKNEKLAFIRRAVVTPTRIIYHFKQPNISNRIIRKFGEDYFIRIRFRDEDLRKLNMSVKDDFTDISDVYSNIKQLLLNGLNCCDRKYNFLAMSSSQLRDHGCWLFFNDINSKYSAENVRNWMGDFSHIRCIGKYAARLGQSLSCSIETFETNNFTFIPDIKVGSYCFTDGIGKISKHKAKEISKKYYDSKEISAFQIRFGGIKGVVAVDPTLNENEPLLFRESMKKFESGYNRLDVLNIAEFIPCYLNRQIISILSSLGVKDEVFSNLQDKMLNQMCNMLIDKHVASNYLTRYFRSQFSFSKTHDLFDYTNEPFFRDVLKTIYQKELQDLIKKSRIYVEKGGILMGCIDETGKLKPDEVFIRCDYDFLRRDKSFIVNGKVIVAKNPCLHPGDVRIMKAVSDPSLSHMINCIVFPACGSRPITNMCSGSDLDGDLYFVSWDEALIPNEMYEPMNYESSEQIKEKSSPIQIEDIIEFFVNFIIIDQLGRLANAHVAISDSSKLGVKDPKCIKLSYLFSKAVDFPKTGQVVKMPSDIKIDEYPDFMQKPGEISYKSNKIIGKMYRQCKEICYFNQNETETIKINKHFLVDGYEDYLDYANEVYLKYRSELESIMTSVNCKNESEFFIGFFLSNSSNNNFKNEDDQNSFKVSSSLVKELWKNTSEQFEFDLKHRFTSDERLKIVSAFYFISYTSKLNIKQQRIISFPWIFEDTILNRISFQNQNQFNRNIISFFHANQNNLQTMSRYIEKIDLCYEIKSILKNNNKPFLIGSFGLFLFEDSNESNIMIFNTTVDEYLKQKLEDYFDNISYSNDGILKCKHDDIATFNLFDFNEKKLCEYIYLRQLIFKNEILWPVLFIIIHFARLDNAFQIIKFDQFLLYCIKYFIEKNVIKDVNQNEVYEEYSKASIASQYDYLSFRLDDWYIIRDYFENDIVYDINISKIIFDFYKYNSFEIISSDEKLKAHFFKILNKLSINNDIKNVWLSINNYEKSQNSEPYFKRKVKMSKRDRLKYPSKNLFVQDASLVLFNKYESELNLVDFDIYKGNRRSYHLNKECFKPRLLIKDNYLSTQITFNEYQRHMIKQIYKAKEMLSDFKFRFQIRFGDFYLTNLPFKLLEQSSHISFYELREALKRGYKTYDFSFHNNSKIELKIQEEELESESENDESKNFISGNFGDYDDEDYSNKDNKKDKKKTKKKKYKNLAFSSFDSNISNDEINFERIFLENEFECKSRKCYIVYFEIKNNENQISAFRVKYDHDLNLVRIETMPIKWLSIDIIKNNISNGKDVRFSLISEKQVDLNGIHFDKTLAEKIKECIIKIDPSVQESLIVKDDFKSCNVFVRESKSTKYWGNYENNWKSLLDIAKIKLSEEQINQFENLFNEKLTVSVSETIEYSQNDVKTGLFDNITKRKEIIVGFKCDINNLKSSEIIHLTNLLWYISKSFEIILD